VDDVDAWLTGGSFGDGRCTWTCPSKPWATPDPLDTWVCAPVDEPTEFPVTDDFHNYARADRTE
jgi:hypothetical protein